MRRRLKNLGLDFMESGSTLKWWTVVLAARLAGKFRSTKQMISAWPSGPVSL